MKWSKIFKGLNLTSDYNLTWDDVWSKLKPIKKALPPQGGFSQNEKDFDTSFIKKLLDQKLRAIEDQKKNISKEEKLKQTVFDLE
jgi:hypothetical protein